MRLVSWNVQHRSDDLATQAARLLGADPDLVALLEVTSETEPEWESCLAEGGLGYSLGSVNRRSLRRYGNLVASRWPSERLSEMEIPFPERALSLRVIAEEAFELHVVHVPPGVSTGIKKVETFEGVYRRLGRRSSLARILCGDFNTPRSETVDGEVLTWAQDPDTGRILPERGERWDAAERSILEGLAAFDLWDTFRLKNGYADLEPGGDPEASWFTSGYSGGKGRRFDHVFASSRFAIESCRYIHEWRLERLSDHSAIEAVLI
jgi:endonuclease/exonuclease/phosphatase family metal-dependent hydrolase